MRKEWYVLQAYSGMENKVKELIEERAKMLGKKRFFGKILIPEKEEIDYRNGKIEKIFISTDAKVYAKSGKDIKKGDLVAEDEDIFIKDSGTIVELKNYRKIIVETNDKKYSKIFLIPERAKIITGLRNNRKVKPGMPFSKDGAYECDVEGEIAFVEKVKRVLVENDDGENDVYIIPLKSFDSKAYKLADEVKQGEKIAKGLTYYAKSSGRIEIKEYSMRKEIKIIKTIRTKLYPGYIFLEMMYAKEAENIVKQVPYVSTFLNVGGKPIRLERKEVRALLRMIGEEDYKENKVTIRTDYEVGEHVKIINGPFEFFTGKITHLDLEKQEAKVAVTMFGRETKVELSLSEIEKIV